MFIKIWLAVVENFIITKFHVMIPNHYGMSLKTIESGPEFISIRFTFFWITSEPYWSIGHGPMGDEYRGFKQEQEGGVFSNMLLNIPAIWDVSWLPSGLLC